MKLRKLDSLRYAFCDLDFFWRRGFEARVTVARGQLFVNAEGAGMLNLLRKAGAQLYAPSPIFFGENVERFVGADA